MSLVSLLLLLSCCTFSLLSADDDAEVLLQIKAQLGNPEVLSSWVKGVDFCHGSGNVDDHVGIVCTSSGRVIAISFYYFWVSDNSFPEAICNLTELQVLSIDRVFGMWGPIPSCIDKLVNLQTFTIHFMNGVSPIPKFLNNKKLTTIDLSFNNLEGPIPPSLSTSSLPNLWRLDLTWTFVNGTIPSELAHHPPAELLLGFNRLSGELPRCAGWENLRKIDLHDNRFRGDASSLFSKQKTVNYIDLSSNQFEFDLSNVQLPENLTYLNLGFNRIYGKVPQSLVWHPVLYLDLKENNLCGEIPQGGNMGQYSNEYIFMWNACLCGSPLPPCSNSALAPAPY